jgi:photosystem II stability/assembly factor-like uncharacterized protein
MKAPTTCLAVIVVLLCPRAFAQWEQAAGPYSGTIRAIAAHGSSLFVGTSEYGVFRSTDGAASWTPVNNGLQNKFLNAFLSVGGRLFVGTNEKMFASTDNGATWSGVASNLPSNGVTCFASSGEKCYAGTKGAGVYRSTDGGGTWAVVNAGLTSYHVYCVAVRDTMVFVGTLDGGVFRSTDSGIHWAQVNSGLGDLWVAALAFRGTRLLAATYYQGVYASTNDGGTWTASKSGLPGSSYWCFGNGANLYVGTVRGHGVYHSTNDGQTWEPANGGLPGTAVWALYENQSSLFAGTGDKGLFVSSNSGLSWRGTSRGLTGYRVASIASDGTTMYAGTRREGGMFASTDGGASWTNADSGLTDPLVNCIAAAQDILLAGTDGGAFVSRNRARSWSKVLTIQSSSPANTVVLHANALDTLFFVGTEGLGVYRSTDRGTTWGTANLGLAVLSVRSLAVLDTSIYAGTPYGVYATGPNPVNWSARFDGVTNPYIRSVVTDGANLFVGTSLGGVFRSTDRGQTWTGLNAGFGMMEVVSVAAQSNLLVAYTDSGIAVSAGGGTGIWTSLKSGLPASTRITAATFVDENLFVGMDGAGIWKRPIAGIVNAVRTDVPQSPTEYLLRCNYPNPFNPSTTIRYGLPERSHVYLAVYNTLGQQVTVLQNGEQEAGYHEVTLDASSLPSGVYFYRLQAGTCVETRKLCLVR